MLLTTATVVLLNFNYMFNIPMLKWVEGVVKIIVLWKRKLSVTLF